MGVPSRLFLGPSCYEADWVALTDCLVTVFLRLWLLGNIAEACCRNVKSKKPVMDGLLADQVSRSV